MDRMRSRVLSNFSFYPTVYSKGGGTLPAAFATLLYDAMTVIHLLPSDRPLRRSRRTVDDEDVDAVCTGHKLCTIRAYKARAEGMQIEVSVINTDQFSFRRTHKAVMPDAVRNLIAVQDGVIRRLGKGSARRTGDGAPDGIIGTARMVCRIGEVVFPAVFEDEWSLRHAAVPALPLRLGANQERLVRLIQPLQIPIEFGDVDLVPVAQTDIIEIDRSVVIAEEVPVDGAFLAQPLLLRLNEGSRRAFRHGDRQMLLRL